MLRQTIHCRNDAALGEIAAPERGGQESIDGEMWSNAVSESGTRGKLCSMGTVAAKDAGIKAEFALPN